MEMENNFEVLKMHFNTPKSEFWKKFLNIEENPLSPVAILN